MDNIEGVWVFSAY